MPIIPLYTLPAHPHASHQVLAPGGYERWQITAEDASQSLRIAVEFWLGDWTDPAYRKAYDRYRRRPTRVSPPKPVDYPSVHVMISRGDQSLVQQITRYTHREVRASVDRPDVTIGPNRLMLDSRDVWQLKIPSGDLSVDPTRHARGTVTIAGQIVTIGGSGHIDHDLGTKPATV